MYSLSSTHPLDPVDPGVNVLVAGPPGTGKSDLVADVLAEGCVRSQQAVFVSVDRDPSTLFDALDDRVASLAPGQVGVVDATDDASGSLPEGVDRRTATAGDLTAIGTACAALVEESTARTRLALFSVTRLLAHADVKTVFRFLHVLTGRLSAANALGLFVVNTRAHDDRTRHTVRQLFDVAIETRAREGQRSFRLTGDDRPEGAWRRF